MIGMIVTGHGSFATGLTSGLKLLAGEPAFYEAVDFEPEDSIDCLTGKLTGAVNRLADCEAVVVFADLTGGSPFNVASRIKLAGTDRPLEVAGGANLPVVLQAYLSREAVQDVVELTESALEAGRAQLVRFDPAAEDDEDDCECEE
ncbi:MAG: PTS sugar transporter subunit IIA [Lachnospiraceae bacterium]|nr:PTS sugar transporter subunit IIA [Lachnospiraceae bacterium]